jgi:CheY-like chemotaxis protein
MDSDSAARSSSPFMFVTEDTEVRLKIPPRLPTDAARREAMRAGMGHPEHVSAQMTRVRVAPLHKPEICTRRVVIPAPKRLRRPVPRRRVLVVDDEPIIRELIGFMLEPEFEVIMLESGCAALERVRSDVHFDVVLSDLMMPELSGMELFQALDRERPDVARRMIFMTGGTFTDAMGNFLSELGATPLLKPFNRDDVHSRIAAKLALVAQGD